MERSGVMAGRYRVRVTGPLEEVAAGFRRGLVCHCYSCRVPEFGHLRRTAVSCCPFVLVDQAAKNRSAPDPFMAEVRHGVGRSWRAKFAGAVGSSTVVVPNVLREHHK